MKRLLSVLAVLGLTATNAPAQDAAAIEAFTGGQTKLVWFTISGSTQSLKYFNTDEGTVKTLGSGFSPISTTFQQDQIRISRSGRWVTVQDDPRTHIYDLSLATPVQRTFLDKSTSAYWCVKAWSRDSVTRTEYAYALENFNPVQMENRGTAIWRIPVKDDGTADLANAAKVKNNLTATIDGAIAVSADQLKMAAQIPWQENPGILDLTTGSFAQRKNNAACHVNLAPDNSYRFFHLDDDHLSVNLYGAAMSTTVRVIAFTGGNGHQNWTPRWSNHPQIVSSIFIAGEIGGDAGWYVADFNLHRFSSNFQSFEATMKVTTGFAGDTWVATGYTGGPPTGVSHRDRPASRAEGSRVTQKAGSIVLDNAQAGAIVRLVDMQGRCVRQWTCSSAMVLDTRGLDAGTYALASSDSRGTAVRLLNVGK